MVTSVGSSRRREGGLRPLLIVVSSPSGGGKTTLCRRYVSEHEGVVLSVSCTTRQPRGGEVDGVNYVFVSEAEFESRVERGLFLEHARVHGFRYGTLRGTVEDSMSRGDSVLLAIDVQGAAQVREGLVRAGNLLQESYLDVFIVPPSLEILRERLVRRGEDAAAVIDQRLRNAEAELRQQEHYRYVVVNDDLDRAYAEFCAILNRERSQAVR